MPDPRRDFRRLPHVLDNLSLVKRFVDEVPVKTRKWRAFQKAAAGALDEMIFMFLPSGLGFPCPKKVLPKSFEPYLAVLPCKTKVIQKTVEQGMAAVAVRMPVCKLIPQKDVHPELTAKIVGPPVCPKTIPQKTLWPAVQHIRPVPKPKK